MVQEWRKADKAERERQRKAEAEEREKDRANMLASMKLMVEALRPARK
jgi:hypothetical protein